MTSWLSAAALSCAAMLFGFGSIVDKDAARMFRSDLGHTSIAVLPVVVRRGESFAHDSAAAGAVARFFEERNLATAIVSEHRMSIGGGWRMNEARMLRESAADVSTFLAAHPANTAYVVYAEYLLGGTGRVVAVHVTVHDWQGRVAYARLVNSHAAIFTTVKPADTKDCTRMLIHALQEDLGRSR
jgi:hypothetical protein